MSLHELLTLLSPHLQRDDFIELDQCRQAAFRKGQDHVQLILSTRDQKVEYVFFSDHILAVVNSALGYPALYPVHRMKIEKPIQAVLMDLDGTSVKSEGFWVWIIQQTTASLLDNPSFELEETDLPYVSGHSVSEHLEYCIRKYCPGRTVEEARAYYFEHTQREMQAILKGHGRTDAFRPAPGLKDFLLSLKTQKIKIGLVTSGLYAKAWPEIVAAFRQMKLGDPQEFYDAIITAGFPMRDGAPGTLGELSPKPHPWLYAEVCRVGLGLPFDQRHQVIGIEDSAAGVHAIRLAGFAVIGMQDGNIVESGAASLCRARCHSFKEVLTLIK